MKSVGSVLWLVEHVARELDVACAVKALAKEKHGLEIDIVPLNSSNDFLSQFRPQVVAIPYGFSLTNVKVADLLALCPEAIFFNMSWEELYYNAYLDARKPRDSWAKNGILHHAWGDFYREYLISHGVPSQHIFVNGQPAYQLFEPPYCDWIPEKKEFAKRVGLDPGKNWIFFPENYGWGFKNDVMLKKFVHYQGMQWDELVSMREFCRDSLRQLLVWIRELLLKKDVEFILRPRPATNPEEFKQFVHSELGDIPRGLHVTHEASVREWIVASDLTLSSISTSLIESALAGKPCFMVLPIPVPSPLEATWQLQAPRLCAQAEFVETCSHIPGKQANAGLCQWARNTLMGNGDPLVNLADLMAKLCHPTVGGEIQKSLRPYFPKDIQRAPAKQTESGEQFDPIEVEKRCGKFRSLASIAKPLPSLVVLEQSSLYQDWEKQGKPLPVPSTLKQTMIRNIISRFPRSVFIESGTFKGAMVDAVKSYFDKVYTIELSPEFYEKARDKFLMDPRVFTLFGDSARLLPEILKENSNTSCLFWLDGHYSGGLTALGDKQTPIQEELETILKDSREDHVILIDDARCFLSGKKDYPSISEIEAKVKKRYPKAVFKVEHDIIHILPPS